MSDKTIPEIPDEWWLDDLMYDPDKRKYRATLCHHRHILPNGNRKWVEGDHPTEWHEALRDAITKAKESQ